ncbi:MAG: biopolymer transporter ExbD [Anaerovibrio sp.]|uniref:ExbD/TolR family protein n=1 Tax=Anaerovibrio sp. TaxID=1872532 RepID=UPI0025FA5DBE|nr:biopolymer transporter ExbD [Anaerovibrio sp.]MCR5176666.1 biopolymer transporter ExbD [Anaerovibrio sp.]
MKLTSTRIEKSPEIMIIPMIDIIFFLLVFFMLSTLYMTDQKTIQINLPKAASAQTDVVKSLQVTVAKDGQLFLGTDPMDLDNLKNTVKRETAMGEISMVLRADGDVDYSKFIGVLDEMKKCGVKKISLAAKS